jgi:hypothetical protein
MRAIRAEPDAFAASLTAVLVILQLWVHGKGFRVMTPLATGGAAFKEYCTADTRPVVNGKALNVKNNACQTAFPFK